MAGLPFVDVLVVESDDETRRLIRHLLDRPGSRFRTFEAADLPQGIELLRQRRFGLVLVARGTSLATALDWVRAVVGAAPSTPVVVHTGYLSDEAGVPEWDRVAALLDAVERAIDQTPGTSAMLREARLRPEYAALYPDVRPGQWGPAAIIADRVLVRLLRYSPPGTAGPRDRVLRGEHFDFRGGAARGPVAHTRLSD